MKPTAKERCDQADEKDFEAAKKFCEQHPRIVSEGIFMAGIAHEREKTRALVEALEFICGKRCAEGLNPCAAREALEAELAKLRADK